MTVKYEINCEAEKTSLAVSSHSVGGAQRQRTRRPEARTYAHVRERTASVLYAAASQSDLPGRQMIWRPGVLRFYNLWMPPILVLQRTEDKALPY